MSEFLGFEPSKNPVYFFLSYNSDDKDAVAGIAKAMMHSGINLWYDFGIDYGEKWEEIISVKIKDSQGVLLLFTKGILAKENSYVQKEYKIAKFLKRKIYVALVDPIKTEDVPIEKISWWVDVNDNQTITLFEAGDNCAAIERLSVMLGVQKHEDRMNMIISAYNALYFEGRLTEADAVLAEYLHKISLRGKAEMIANIALGGFQQTQLFSPAEEKNRFHKALQTHTGEWRRSFTECRHFALNGDIFTVGNGFIFHRGRHGDAHVIWIWKNGELIHTIGRLIEAFKLSLYYDSIDDIIYIVYLSDNDELDDRRVKDLPCDFDALLSITVVENPNDTAVCTDFQFLRPVRLIRGKTSGDTTAIIAR